MFNIKVSTISENNLEEMMNNSGEIVSRVDRIFIENELSRE